jgi:transposase
MLDNGSVHKAERLRQTSAARHCQLLVLPPASPDCTPIEQAFSQITAILRGLGARTKEALQEAVRLAIEAIPRHDAAAWFAHAGYALPAQAT